MAASNTKTAQEKRLRRHSEHAGLAFAKITSTRRGWSVYVIVDFDGNKTTRFDTLDETERWLNEWTEASR